LSMTSQKFFTESWFAAPRIGSSRVNLWILD